MKTATDSLARAIEATKQAKAAEKAAFAAWSAIGTNKVTHTELAPQDVPRWEAARKVWEKAEAAFDRALRHECDLADELDKVPA